MTEEGRTTLLEFPCAFPIKIMGPTHVDFAPTMLELVISHDPTFHAGRMEERPSGKGNYTGLTVTVRAISREQLDAEIAEIDLQAEFFAQ